MRNSDWSSDVCSSELICERRAYSLPSLLAHVAEKKLGELGKLTPKDLLYFASTDSVCGDIPITIGVDKWVNDRLRRVRWRLAESSGTRVTNIQLHQLGRETSRERGCQYV